MFLVIPFKHTNFIFSSTARQESTVCPLLVQVLGCEKLDRCKFCHTRTRSSLSRSKASKSSNQYRKTLKFQYDTGLLNVTRVLLHSQSFSTSMYITFRFAARTSAIYALLPFMSLITSDQSCLMDSRRTTFYHHKPLVTLIPLFHYYSFSYF